MSEYQSCSSCEAKEHENSDFDKLLDPRKSDTIPTAEVMAPRLPVGDSGFVYESPIIMGTHNAPGTDAWTLKVNGANP